MIASESETTTHPPIFEIQKFEIQRIRRRIRHLICFSLIPRLQTIYITQRDIQYMTSTQTKYGRVSKPPELYTPEETTDDSKEEEVSRRTKKILLDGVPQCTLDATFWEKKPDGSMKCIGVCKQSLGKRIFSRDVKMITTSVNKLLQRVGRTPPSSGHPIIQMFGTTPIAKIWSLRGSF